MSVTLLEWILQAVKKFQHGDGGLLLMWLYIIFTMDSTSVSPHFVWNLVDHYGNVVFVLFQFLQVCLIDFRYLELLILWWNHSTLWCIVLSCFFHAPLPFSQSFPHWKLGIRLEQEPALAICYFKHHTRSQIFWVFPYSTIAIQTLASFIYQQYCNFWKWQECTFSNENQSGNSIDLCLQVWLDSNLSWNLTFKLPKHWDFYWTISVSVILNIVMRPENNLFLT